ncbi:MAG TPA: hypothetical protein VMV79_01280 [Alphaproteobacteria bacterium]|nr:hypothetical protein [Alphaproteobacteria bacterium]
MISILGNHDNEDKPVLVADLITTDEDRKFAPAGCMATAIVDLTRKNGGCLPQDLNVEGFSPDEVAEFWHMAHSLAAVELKLMEGQSLPGCKMEKRYA